MAAFVSQTKGTIGYVEYAYVLQNKMTFGLLQNKAGKFLGPEPATFEAAASSADWADTKDFYLTMTDAPGKESYPITATTFVIMYKKPKNIDRAAVAMDFFNGRSTPASHKQVRSAMSHCPPLSSGRSKRIGIRTLPSSSTDIARAPRRSTVAPKQP